MTGGARRSLVIGYGSIGRRHHRLLRELGAAPGLVSRRPQDLPDCFDEIGAALTVLRPGLVVVASETGRHAADLAALAAAGYDGPLLVEKPLLARSDERLPAGLGAVTVGYHLRCHPLVEALRAALAGRRPIAARLWVGQHLADWRPERGLTGSYSAHGAQGGGALRDLSHELDLLLWLCGPWERVAAAGGNGGALGIAADDHWQLLLTLRSGAVASLSLDMLSRPPRRGLVLETAEGTLALDLLAGRLTIDGEERGQAVERDACYREQLRRLLAGETAALCDAAAGLAVVALIDAAERAAAEGRWIDAGELAA